MTIIGLSSSGLNVISGGTSDPLQLGGCKAEYLDDNGFCTSHVLSDARVWLGVIVGGIVTAFLMLYRVKGALLWPLLLVAIISWPRPTAVTQFPHTDLGDSNFDFFKKVATVQGFKLLGPSNVEWSAYKSGNVWIAIVSLLTRYQCSCIF